MNKSDIVRSLLKKNNKYKISEIESIVYLFFKEIEKALKEGKRIEIRGFGSFFTKVREKRICLNPQNGKNIEIEKKVHPKFKMGKILFRKLNTKWSDILFKNKFKRVFLAVDTNNIKSAENFIKLLKNDLAGIKIGKELFSYYGPNIIKKFKKYKLPIFLDLKFHDIPSTVYKAVKAINFLKVNYLSIHGLGGSKMIKAATKAASYTKILTVSLLSHHNQKSINELGIEKSIKNEIKKLIFIAIKNNTAGLILAPKDLEIAKKINKNIVIFAPGIREKKNRKHEHKRSMGPLNAIKKGATYIVIGRPITKSQNPKRTLKLINEEIKNYLKKNNGT